MVSCQERILLVEDEEDIAFVLKIRLEAVGYEVHTEASGAVALSYAAQHQPNLVILDIKLPDLGGHEVCRELRKLYGHSELPVLMFTGLDGPMDDIPGFVAGADRYLSKRSEPEELFRAVEELLSQPA